MIFMEGIASVRQNDILEFLNIKYVCRIYVLNNWIKVCKTPTAGLEHMILIFVAQ